MAKFSDKLKKVFSGRVQKILILLVFDIGFGVAAFVIARSVYNFMPLERYERFFDFQFLIASVFIAVTVLMLVLLDSYNAVWRYAGRVEFYKVILAYLAATGLLFVFTVILSQRFDILVPATVILMYLMFSLIFSSLIRFNYAIRGYAVHLKRKISNTGKGQLRTVIIGGGESGTLFIRRALDMPQEGFFPVAVIDDDVGKQGGKIQGVKVEGGLDRLGAVIKKTRAEAIVIAIVSLPKMSLKELVQACKPFNLPVKIAKPIKDVDAEDTDIKALELQEIKIEELLGREEITVNQVLLQGAVKGKRVLVTGGVGSIGSELCRQSLLAGCKHLIVLDMHENGMFEFCEELKKKFKPKRFTPVVANVREEKRVAQIFEEYKPEIVFHAAAYKHVPVMEYSASEAIKNNVFGTLNMIEAAQKANTERFIFISTDKAVNPANIMGASKRIAEMLIQDIGRNSKMKIAAVRFGNVLGSNGSVIPIFLKQIKDGGPITITDRRIKRYFMSIPEAVRLVLQAGSLAEAGDVFVLDMGEPVLIYDLACDLIRLNGLVPEEDIKFKEIGLREGEKMFEELRYDKESAGVTSHEGIFVSHLEEIDSKKFNAQIAKLKKFAFDEDIKKTTEVIFEMVPSSFRGMEKEEQMATSEYVGQGVRKSETFEEIPINDTVIDYLKSNIDKAGEA